MPWRSSRRPADLRRSWLFVPGAERARLEASPSTGADVLIQELEDFTPPDRRPEARALARDILPMWRSRGALAAVRINPLEICGAEDLAAVMAGAPDIVMMSMVATPEQVMALDAGIARLERDYGLVLGSTEIVPNIETAAGLVRTGLIAKASSRVSAALVAAEDMVADLGAERGPDCAELAYVRERFLVECVAAGIIAIDCPYTFSDVEASKADLIWARRRGYKAKSVVDFAQVPGINAALTPAEADVAHARRIVAAFDQSRAEGRERCDVDGLLVEVPTVKGARRLIARAEAFASLAR
jgi:citrate lyase subunit beta/citryl-CoA lyase